MTFGPVWMLKANRERVNLDTHVVDSAVGSALAIAIVADRRRSHISLDTRFFICLMSRRPVRRQAGNGISLGNQPSPGIARRNEKDFGFPVGGKTEGQGCNLIFDQFLYLFRAE